jgi:hypothetical protein
MSEPVVTGAGGEVAGSSSLRTLLDTLIAPREAFAALRARPRFALALVVLVATGVLALHVAMSKVSAADVLRSIEESGRELPPGAAENPERILSFTRWSQVVSAALGAPILYLALAGIFLATLRLLGGELGYRHSLAVVVHGLLPFAVAAVLGTAVAAGRDSIALEELKWGGLLASNLGPLAGAEASDVARALLTSVDVFSIWCVALLATGFRIVAGVASRAAWGAVLVVWAAGVALKLGLATLF